jgi:hypothetical protein
MNITIDPQWIGEEISREAIEKLTIVDVMGGDPESVVDKGDWWKQSYYANKPEWISFISFYQEGDRIHKWSHPFYPFSGYVIKRGDEVLNVFQSYPL